MKKRLIFTNIFPVHLIDSMEMGFCYSKNRTDAEKTIAEKFGIGVSTGSTFTLKENLRDDIGKMCLPSIKVKEMKGIITHVRLKTNIV